nr:unnamed protein product [Callosobruchus analis]
MQKAIFG